MVETVVVKLSLSAGMVAITHNDVVVAVLQEQAPGVWTCEKVSGVLEEYNRHFKRKRWKSPAEFMVHTAPVLGLG